MVPTYRAGPGVRHPRDAAGRLPDLLLPLPAQPEPRPRVEARSRKFILYIEMGGKRMVVAADAAAPTAWRKAPYYAQFKRWALAGAGSNHQILVFNGTRATAILPDRDLDLGTVEVGDEVIYHPGQGRIDVELRRKAG